MSQDRKTNFKGKQVAVVVGATSKWQSNGRNTLLAHGQTVDDSALPVGARWGVGGAIAQKFAQEGFFVVLTTRNEANASFELQMRRSLWLRRGYGQRRTLSYGVRAIARDSAC